MDELAAGLVGTWLPQGGCYPLTFTADGKVTGLLQTGIWSSAYTTQDYEVVDVGYVALDEPNGEVGRYSATLLDGNQLQFNHVTYDHGEILPVTADILVGQWVEDAIALPDKYEFAEDGYLTETGIATRKSWPYELIGANEMTVDGEHRWVFVRDNGPRYTLCADGFTYSLLRDK